MIGESVWNRSVSIAEALRQLVYEVSVRPELIIFDCDGVLVDSEVIACRADALCLAEIGIAISAEEIMDRYLGISAAEMCTDIELRLGRSLPANFTETLRARVAAVFDTELVPIVGVEAMLEALPFRRCVASSSAVERLRHSLSLTGLLGYFEPNIFSATQVGRGKPAPDLFWFAADSMQATRATCLVIEDSVPGVQAAVAAGIPVIGFTGGGHCRPGHADRLLAAGAVTVASAMWQVPGLVGDVGRSTQSTTGG
jgi:HAD superfamily hydrolase (TIGR01509 family)